MFDNKFCIPIQEKENGKKKINLNWSLPLKLVPQVWKPSTEKIMNVFLPKKKIIFFDSLSMTQTTTTKNLRKRVTPRLFILTSYFFYILILFFITQFQFLYYYLIV